MFLVVFLGLAATVTALPLVREVENEKEGVILPIYKPWYNVYGRKIFGSQYSQFDKNILNYFMNGKNFQVDNYDSMNLSPFAYRLNYFSKYMQPGMMNMNYEYPDMVQNMGYLYNNYLDMFRYMRNYMRYPFYNEANKYFMYRPYSQEYMYGNKEKFKNNYLPNDVTYHNMYRPYSNEYMYGIMDNLKNMFYPYYNKEYAYFDSPEYSNIKSTHNRYQNYMNDLDLMYRPYSFKYMNEYMGNFKNLFNPLYNNMNDFYYMYRPYSPEYMVFKNTHPSLQNNVDNVDYVYKPYISGYPQNFVDMSYASNNMNGYGYTNMPNYSEYMKFKNMYYPYSPEYMKGFMQNFNMRYPFYNEINRNYYTQRQNDPENKGYQFYNNVVRTNNGAEENVDEFRAKRQLTRNEGKEKELEHGNPIGHKKIEALSPSDPELHIHHSEIARAVPILERGVTSMHLDVEGGGQFPSSSPSSESIESSSFENSFSSSSSSEPNEFGHNHVRKTRGIGYTVAPHHYYPYYVGYPYYSSYVYPSYTYHPLWYNAYYYKK